MMSNQKPNLTTEEFEVRVWGFVVIVVTCILCFIVIALLYSVTFVTQPIKSMAPIDQAYTKMLNDIVLLIVGGIGGVMTKRAAGAAAKAFGAPVLCLFGLILSWMRVGHLALLQLHPLNT